MSQWDRSYYNKRGNLPGGSAGSGKRGGFGGSTGVITIDEAEFKEAWAYFDKMKGSLDPKWMKRTLKRNAKPIVADMKQGSVSLRLVRMIGSTINKRRAGRMGLRLGVIKNDAALFPKFSAPALASLFEYGTQERFRQLKKLGLVIGRQSTGRMTAVPFLRPAWNRGKAGMISKTVSDIKRRVL